MPNNSITQLVIDWINSFEEPIGSWEDRINFPNVTEQHWIELKQGHHGDGVACIYCQTEVELIKSKRIKNRNPRDTFILDLWNKNVHSVNRVQKGSIMKEIIDFGHFKIEREANESDAGKFTMSVDSSKLFGRQRWILENLGKFEALMYAASLNEKLNSNNQQTVSRFGTRGLSRSLTPPFTESLTGTYGEDTKS